VNFNMMKTRIMTVVLFLATMQFIALGLLFLLRLHYSCGNSPTIWTPQSYLTLSLDAMVILPVAGTHEFAGSRRPISYARSTQTIRRRLRPVPFCLPVASYFASQTFFDEPAESRVFATPP
jgi:hypothetical protein